MLTSETSPGIHLLLSPAPRPPLLPPSQPPASSVSFVFSSVMRISCHHRENIYGTNSRDSSLLQIRSL
ncbi:hypothetical protein L596_014575 [Steinernema carpocapsae]|uniref:Uncharacterized protein n=1 Tax=Steinernema carpocapsae TaxID=34508 RepID=A0A4U5NDE1_STECR|nr:hypothetical protein L596_014575 [Steinernema carpocapsae]